MNLIAVLIDEDGGIIASYGPFSSHIDIYRWSEKFLRGSGIKCYRYEIVGLVGVTEDKG
tara:strand:+ start:191 stop:367 length:177 start_codon:yes stop_codon:yes gene_type:complete